MLKSLDAKEASRAKAFADKRGDGHCGIVAYEIHDSLGTHGKCYMTMPCLPSTLEHISQLDAVSVAHLWDDIGGALDFLHALGFAHSDVKPSNICVDGSGRFVLIDVGSLETFGERTTSTRVYLPREVESGCASSATDWWMLAMTLAEKACGADSLARGLGSVPPVSKVALVELLRRHLAPEVQIPFFTKLTVK